MKKILLFLLCSLAANVVFAQSTETVKSLYFATAKHDLTPESEAALNELIAELPKYETYTLTIQGNTDDKGNAAYNQALSERRAAAAKQFLVTKGINANLITLTAYGEEKPIADNTEEVGKQKNRRVDVFLRGAVKTKKVEIAKQPKPAIIALSKDTIKEKEMPIATVLQQIAPKIETFEIDPNKDAVIRGKKGTIVYIKSGTFKTRKNCKVKFELQEIQEKSDMIGANIATQNSDGQLLATEGMVYTAAKDCSGNVLKMQKGKDLVISVPTDSIKQNVGVFNGAGRNTHDSTMLWTMNNNSVLENFKVEDVLYCNNLDFLFQRCGLDRPCWRFCGFNFMDCCSICCGFKPYACEQWKYWYKNHLVITPEKAMTAWIDISVRYENRSLFAAYNECQTYSKIENLKQKLSILLTDKVARNENQIKAQAERIEKLETREKELAIQWSKYEEAHNYWQAKYDSITGITAWRDSMRRLDIARLPLLQRKLDSLNGAFVPTATFDATRVGQCYNLQKLYEKYGVADIDDLAYKLNEALMQKFGVNTIPALRQAIDKQNLKNIEIAYKSKSVSFADLKYYVFNTSRLGYENLDIFKPSMDLVTMKLDQKVGNNIVCKLVFKLENSVVASDIDKVGKEGDRYIFKDVPRNTPVWIVAIKNENGKPFLSIEESTVQAKTYHVQWQEMTIETLRERLKTLDL
jgi:hypothetical protein